MARRLARPAYSGRQKTKKPALAGFFASTEANYFFVVSTLVVVVVLDGVLVVVFDA